MPVLLGILAHIPSNGPGGTLALLIYTTETASVAEQIETSVLALWPNMQIARASVVAHISEQTEAFCYNFVDEQAQLGIARQPIINISGGTTLMAVGAQHAAAKRRWPMFYIDSDNGQIIRLAPDGHAQQPDDLAVAVAVKQYAEAHGVACTPKPPWGTLADTGSTAFEQLVAIAREIGELGSQSAAPLNWLRQAIPGTPTFAEPASDDPLLALLLNHDLVRKSGSHWQYGPSQSEGFVSGAWLELFVYDQCRHTLDDDGRPLFDDVRLSRLLTRTALGMKAIENEIDVMVTHRGRMVAISCKTGSELINRDLVVRSGSPSTKDDKKAKEEALEKRKLAVYELDSLLQTELMGVYTRKALVTNQAGATIVKELSSLAYASKVALIAGESLLAVAKQIRMLMSKPTL